MNLPRTPEPPRSTEAELDAFEQVCERLAGFDASIDAEWADGYLTALAAGPVRLPPEVWLERLTGDAFERAFADPPDHAQALATVQARLSVLERAFEPDALLDAPDQLRFDPLCREWTEEDRAKAKAESELSDEEVGQLRTGALWASGVLEGIESNPDVWPDPGGGEGAGLFAELLDQIEGVMFAPGSQAHAAFIAEYYPDHATKGMPTDDDLLAEACYAVQALRIWGLDHGPRPAPRRVEAKVGRNDPCPCGSGKKFKKCHGAEA
jgi:uncharacterized protein